MQNFENKSDFKEVELKTDKHFPKISIYCLRNSSCCSCNRQEVRNNSMIAEFVVTKFLKYSVFQWVFEIDSPSHTILFIL